MSATVSTPTPGRWLAVLLSGQPHQIITNHDSPYLQRWYLIARNRFCNIYLHRFVASDDPTCHDHPWGFASVLLSGSYDEVEPHRITHRRWGSIAFRRPRHCHSVRLHRDASGDEIPCVSVIITGPRIREWGFWCPRGNDTYRFVPWRQFGAGGCGENESEAQPMTQSAVERLATIPGPFALAGPHRHTVTTNDGVALRVSDQRPDGPVEHTVVLLHGLCLRRQSWYRPARRLRQPGLRVIGYDHRGHGRSERAPLHTYTPDRLAQDLADVLTALQVDGPLTLAGHSMGGFAALSYLARPLPAQPVRPQGLVLVATSAGHLAEHGLGRLLSLPGLDTAMNAVHHLPQVMSERVMHTLARPLCDIVTRDKATSASLTDAFRSTSASTALGFLHSLKTYDRHSVLPTISATTTVISGGADLLTPPAHSDTMADAIPGVTRIHLPDAGHMLLHEAASVVGDAILRTVAKPGTPLRPTNQLQREAIATPA